jgi:hypothetical protein
MTILVRTFNANFLLDKSMLGTVPFCDSVTATHTTVASVYPICSRGAISSLDVFSIGLNNLLKEKQKQDPFYCHPNFLNDFDRYQTRIHYH